MTSSPSTSQTSADAAVPTSGTAADSPGLADDAPAAGPSITIESGNPTPEQVAILVAVLSAIGGEPEPEPEHGSLWSDPARRLGGRVSRGAGSGTRGRSGWAASGLPR